MKNTKICLNMMVGNESHIIHRVLESCYKHIDYWIIQCNGSDNTQELIEEFFKEKNIPGYCYNVEWHYPGWNSDSLIQECQKANHNCDWFFRIDADEQLEVDDDFDWSILNNTSVQSWDVIATTGGASWTRSRIWNAKLPWRFKHDKRHECIILPGCGPTEEEFQRVSLGKGFRHFITSDGNSYVDPVKFLTDALELENQHISQNTLLSDSYHFFYVAKSYYDCYRNSLLPLGYEHQKEYARRCIFYAQEFVKYFYNGNEDECIYYAQFMIGDSYKFCEQYEESIIEFKKCNLYSPRRNEHLYGLTEVFMILEDYQTAYKFVLEMMKPERKNPFPDLVFLIHNGTYYDTGHYVQQMYDQILDKLQKTQ